MQREKLFFSTIYLVLAMFASLAIFPLLFSLINDARLAAKIGAGVFILLPIFSLTLLWCIHIPNIYLLRRISFFVWGILLTFLGIGNFSLPKTVQTSYGNVAILGVALIAISFYIHHKELTRKNSALKSTQVKP